MEITPSLTAAEVVAKVMMAARDPDLEATGGVAPSELTGSAPSTPATGAPDLALSASAQPTAAAQKELA
jgi:hypothetical protein